MFRFPRIVVVIAALAVPWVALAEPAPPPTTGPTSKPEPGERDVLVAELARIPQAPPTTVDGFVVVRIDDGFLDIAAKRAGDRQYAVTLTDWPGLIVVGQTPGTDRLSFVHHLFAGQDERHTITQIETGGGVMTLSRDTESTSGVHSVQLIQHRTGNENVAPVQLLVADNPGESNTPPPTRTTLTAATFAELCREQPQAVREHLLPIFRDLKADKLVRTSDAARAWQVLGNLVPADPATVADVETLLKRADGDDVADRAEAADDLAKLGPAGAAELRRRDLAALPPEPRSAAEDAMRRNEPLRREQATRLAHDVPFLIDTLRLDDARLADAAAKRLAIVTGRPIDLPRTLSAAERNRRIDAYAAIVMPATQPTQPTRVQDMP